ncbi:MAG: class I tRNA ligase family protein [Ginsengibacter sp.]
MTEINKEGSSQVSLNGGDSDGAYNFRKIEEKWQQKWKDSGIYKVANSSYKPKCYVLDMFPYPSGAGLHVGHPLGYIASDIYARYKRLKGFNVLHPMGYDSFGLPAEQYALETGQHPAVTTEKNIETFRSQLDNIGFSFDWSREVRTSDPKYYKWTQWIFLQIFNSYFCNTEKKALPISKLIDKYATRGSKYFTAEQWNGYSEKQQQDILMERRLAFIAYGEVNWCEALGTVLANDEVINGVSERGGHPVVKKKMRQWYLRITSYAERLLQGLETVEFSDAMKEMQRNWIGKSEGAEITFNIQRSTFSLQVYTTRPDTIFGVDFMVLAPEHDLVNQITTPEQKEEIAKYLEYTKGRSERERLAEVKSITGAFTGAYAINPFDSREIPIWISEYVLAGYGTGAIMAVPCGDQRDFNFAKHFNIPITNIIGDDYNGEEANPTKEAVLINSGFLNGMLMKDAIPVVLLKIEETGIGKRKVNYKMRDAGFSRQRYWGEPFPIIYKDGVAYAVDEKHLPVELPHVEIYKSGPEGKGPLANIHEWVDLGSGAERETNTMPGYAGSSWYFLRYMDPHNDAAFADKKVTDYWNQVDVYIGGTEHAVGHLLYSRLWTKILFDLDLISFDEPFKKLLNQGMIQGSSRLVFRFIPIPVEPGGYELIHKIKYPFPFIFVSINYYNKLIDEMGVDPREVLNIYLKNFSSFTISEEELEYYSFEVYPLRVDVNLVDGVELNINEFRKWRNGEYANATFILEDGKVLSFGEDLGEVKSKYICGVETEKMSKSKYNTINPNEIINKYGADTFRMYEMFLGPVEQSKPWDTKGIEGIHRFLKKLWRLFYDDIKGKIWNGEKASDAELKVLHKTIKKIEEDTERFSYNTAVSAFMICVNELTDLKCHKKEILEPLLILIAPYTPHIAEELWHHLKGSPENRDSEEVSILDASFPKLEPKYLVEAEKEYPVSINAKMRTTIKISLDASAEEVEKIVLQNEVVQKWMDGKPLKKLIYVKNKMINVLV